MCLQVYSAIDTNVNWNLTNNSSLMDNKNMIFFIAQLEITYNIKKTLIQ